MPTITKPITCSGSSTPKGEFKVLIAREEGSWGEVRKTFGFDKKKMYSYNCFLVILGHAELNAVFHLLGYKRRK
jgi:hypothetical protein